MILLTHKFTVLPSHQVSPIFIFLFFIFFLLLRSVKNEVSNSNFQTVSERTPTIIICNPPPKLNKTLLSLPNTPHFSLSLSPSSSFRSPAPIPPPPPPPPRPQFHHHDFHSTAELSSYAASQRRAPCLAAGLHTDATPKALFDFLQDPADFFACYFLVVSQI